MLYCEDNMYKIEDYKKVPVDLASCEGCCFQATEEDRHCAVLHDDTFLCWDALGQEYNFEKKDD